MPEIAQGLASFDGFGVTDAEFHLESGIVPSGGYAKISALQFEELKKRKPLRSDNHTLEMKSGGLGIDIKELHITSTEQTEPTAPVTIRFQDRRWRWQEFYGLVQDFNVCNEEGVGGGKKKSALACLRETVDFKTYSWYDFYGIITRLLAAMGEESKTIPKLDFPLMSIRSFAEKPARVIADLLSRVNYSITLNSKGEIDFFKKDFNPSPFGAPEKYVKSRSSTESVEKFPDCITIIGSRIIDQRTSLIQPVFVKPPWGWPWIGKLLNEQEIGDIIPLNSKEGWEYFGFSDLADAYLAASTDFKRLESNRPLQEIAKKYLFKWWQILPYDYIGTEAVKEIKDVWTRVPFLKTLNQVIYDFEGRACRTEMRLTASLYRKIEKNLDADGGEAVKGKYEFIPEYDITGLGLSYRHFGIVTTNDILASIKLSWPATDEKMQQPQTPNRITYCYEKKGSQKWQDDYYNFTYPEGSTHLLRIGETTPRVLFLRMKEFRQLQINGTDINKDELDNVARKFLKIYWEELKQTSRSEEIKLSGIFPYSPNSKIASVSWSASCSGYFTTVKTGGDHGSRDLPSIQDRIKTALTEVDLLIEGAELTRTPGEEFNLGIADFRSGERNDNFHYKEDKFKIINAHHAGLIPMSGRYVESVQEERSMFCRIPDYDSEDDHIHNIDSVGPLIESENAPLQSSFPSGASSYYAKCGLNFTARGVDPAKDALYPESCDGYWHIQIKTPYYEPQWEGGSL